MFTLSADVQQKLKPIEEQYPGLRIEDHIFILEVRTGFAQIMSLIKGSEAAFMAMHLETVAAERERGTSSTPPKRVNRRRRSA